MQALATSLSSCGCDYGINKIKKQYTFFDQKNVDLSASFVGFRANELKKCRWRAFRPAHKDPPGCAQDNREPESELPLLLYAVTHCIAS